MNEIEVRNLQARVRELEQQLVEARAAILAAKGGRAHDDRSNGYRELDAEQDRLRANERRWRQAILTAPYPLMIRRDDGRVVLINRAWTDITGYTLEDIPTIGAWSRKAFGKAGMSTQSLVLNEGFSNVKEWGELEVTTRSGEKRIWDFSTAPLGVDQTGRRLVVAMAVDITERKKAEEELREARDRAMWLARFPDENPNPVARVSAKGIILYHNPSAASSPGWGCEVSRPLQSPLLSLVERAMAQGRVVEQDLALGERSYWVAVRPVMDAGYANLYGRDITERKRVEAALEESEERFHSLADSMPQLVWMAQPDGTVDYYNQRHKEYHEIRQLQKEAREWAPFLHPEDLQPTVEAWRHAVKTGDAYQIEHRVRMAGGSYRWHLSRSIPVRDEKGRITRWFGTATDIHDLKLAEEKLEEYADRLERSNRDLQDFAYMASHDLQEPLRKVEAFGAALYETSTNLSEKQRDYIGRMRNAAGRMRGMVDGLLALSKVDRTMQPFGHVGLNQIVAEVLAALKMQIRRTGGRVEVGDLPEIQADSVQMHQLLQNLIGNALKFHPRSAPPEVKVHARQGAAAVELIVEDNGIGFQQSDAERIFQPFQRLVSRNEYHGSGMGLAICRQIVEQHNGTIAAFGRPGQGATFIVTLPIYPANNS